MLGEIESGAGGVGPGDNSASGKVILGRGCDPAMAARAGTMLPPMLGNAQIESVTDDNEFFLKLKSGKKYDVRTSNT